MNLVWARGRVTVKEIHDQLLSDPDRELTYSSVTTVLRRLSEKGWLACDNSGRVFTWQPRVSQPDAQALQSHQKFHDFLAVSTPEVVAAFAESLDEASVEQLEAITRRIEAIRRAREGR